MKRYNITCKKCGEVRDITNQVNSELDFKRKEILDDFAEKIKKELTNRINQIGGGWESYNPIDVLEDLKLSFDKILKEMK